MADGKKMIDIMLRTAGALQNAGEDVDIVQGKVITAAPLEIEVESKLVLTSDFLLVASWLKPLTLVATLADGSGATLQVSNGLQTGDIVLMLRVARGQKYFVIDKEVAA
ncbi:DUF2577 domain-containing protein [Ruminococcaceae bacterium OttesenSCG-928-N02]|nr:DUF2577 domain-containing protein [Ruminococcaceae bacterium OttesenSCG-928-N02]